MTDNARGLMLTIKDARPLYANADPVHDFSHVLRVLRMAEHLAAEENADPAIVRTAVLLHDVSRPDDAAIELKAGAQADHALQAAAHARAFLTGEDADFIDAVAHAIEAHRFRNQIEPQTIEAQVVFDADKLDAIGAVGIARSFAYGGVLGQPLWGDVSADYTPGSKDEPHTAHHEFHVKLRQIKDRLYTDAGRKIAAERHQFMVEFFTQMSAEVRGER